MKSTRMESSVNGLNQIYSYAHELRASWVIHVARHGLNLPAFFCAIISLLRYGQAFVDNFNANVTSLEGNRGPVSKYALPDEKCKGKIELILDKNYYEGIACSLDFD
ncbi:hypothetical protein CCR75_006604 [Bremia lactucae]|uniref:Uncharacterized protein n=1 Tax=Bremia lactucae TaxID=4779 RepID=A0A976FR85_BRELC|nr:hypothetical protein CCR75_006604 [Bremia lactucae]